MPRNVQEIVEGQVLRWRAQREAADRQARERINNNKDHEEPPRSRAIAISYAPYTNGMAIADGIAARLGLPHYDQEIVEHIASVARVHVSTVESLDAHVQNRVDEYIDALFHERNFDRGDYLRLLGSTVAALWEHGPCVLSGHAAVHLVPREHVLTVRLGAPPETRARRLARAREIELTEAQRALRREDAEQEAFHRRFFDADVNDLTHYDLTLDLEQLDEDAAVAIVTHAFETRFGASLPDEQPTAQR